MRVLPVVVREEPKSTYVAAGDSSIIRGWPNAVGIITGHNWGGGEGIFQEDLDQKYPLPNINYIQGDTAKKAVDDEEEMNAMDWITLSFNILKYKLLQGYTDESSKKQKFYTNVYLPGETDAGEIKWGFKQFKATPQPLKDHLNEQVIKLKQWVNTV